MQKIRPGALQAKKSKSRKRAWVHLEFQAQWIAAASGRVPGALVRLKSEINRRHMIKNGSVLMIANRSLSDFSSDFAGLGRGTLGRQLQPTSFWKVFC